MIYLKGFSTMTKRERVEAAMSFEETDRTPIYDILLNDALIEYVTGIYPPVGEEGLKLKCKTISRVYDMTRAVEVAPRIPGENTTSDGFTMAHGRWLSLGIIKRPFGCEDGAIIWLEEAIRKLRTLYKKEYNYGSVRSNFRERFLTLQRYIGDDTVILNGQSGTGLDTVRHSLGLEIFSYISSDRPDLISEYLELSTELEVMRIHAIADKKLSLCALTFGDIAHKTGLMHSPEWLRIEFIPRLRKLNDAWHEHGIKCLFHSDGNINEFIPDLISAGIDGLNPIETVAGMDLKDLRAKYGQSIFLAGGIDMSYLLAHGTVEENARICKESINVASPGYFIGSTTEVDNTSRLENLLVMLRTAGLDI